MTQIMCREPSGHRERRSKTEGCGRQLTGGLAPRAFPVPGACTWQMDFSPIGARRAET
jgi:hypothetical protein